MIGVIFEFINELFTVTIDKNNVYFTDSNGRQSQIDGLKLNYEGVIKELPDLVDNPEWKKETIKRFKEKIKSFESEEEKMDYIINDLRKFGYVPKFIQKKGFRIQKVK